MTDMNQKFGSGSSTGLMDAEKQRGMTGSVADAASGVKEKVQQWADTATEKVKDAATATGEMAADAKDKVQEWATTAASKAEETAMTAGRELTELVRRYPIQSLLVGVVAGLLLARATARR